MLNNVIDEAVQEIAGREEQEILGAWRAGYDYLHVCQRPWTHTFGAKRRHIASDNEKPPRTYRDSSWMVKTYDLRWLFPQDVEELTS